MTAARPHLAQASFVATPRAGDPAGDGPVAVTIGNFDGVHRGHAALIQAARKAVGASGRAVGLSFDPNPLSTLRPDAVPPRLSTFEQRARWLKELGADEVVRITPTHEFLQQDAETFLARLCERWQPRFIVEGSGFRFGRGRAGSIETLQALESRWGYRTIAVDAVEVALSDQSLVRASSSLTRWLLAHGRVRDAMIVLGRPFEIEAKVVPGDRRGRDIGFPTANLAPLAADQLLPGDGVYAGVASRLSLSPEGSRDKADEGRFLAAISVGTKPTFGEHPRTCEAHLLDYHGPLDDYGWSIRLWFTHWLRDQLMFSDVAALIAHVQRDVAQARELLSNSQCQHKAIGAPSPTPST